MKTKASVNPCVTTQSESWDIAEQIVQIQRRAIREGDFDLWMQTTHFEDDLVNDLHKLWFEGYLCRIRPTSVLVELVDVGICDEGIRARSKLRLEYSRYDPVEEERTYFISYVPTLRAWRIVRFTSTPFPFPKKVIKHQMAFEFGPMRTSRAAPWWQQQEYVSLASRSSDPLSPQVYARAIPRTVRFREAHPEIECAAVLSDLMSIQVSQLGAQVVDSDPLQFLANLYHLSQQRIVFRIERSDRDNTWFSKLHAPWFNFDEIAARCKDREFIVGYCPSIMSFFLALLRMGGYGPCDVFQLRLYNHDVLLVRIGSDAFLLCTDRVLELGPRTLYHATQITKAFTEAWYWTSLGATNMGEPVRREFLGLLKEKLPAFDFIHSAVKGSVCPELPRGAPLPSFRTSDDSLELSHLIRKHVFQSSSRYPYSPYTWAKYAYQTLFVAKPESYAAWSLQSPLVRTTIRRYLTLRELLRTVQGLGLGSIFCESDRLMTADQVIRHKSGDPKARALLLFTLFKLREEKAGFILLTDQGAYCVWPDEKKWQVWDSTTLKPTSSPEGNLVLAFDDTYSFYPLVKGEAEMPPWHHILTCL